MIYFLYFLFFLVFIFFIYQMNFLRKRIKQIDRELSAMKYDLFHSEMDAKRELIRHPNSRDEQNDNYLEQMIEDGF